SCSSWGCAIWAPHGPARTSRRRRSSAQLVAWRSASPRPRASSSPRRSWRERRGSWCTSVIRTGTSTRGPGTATGTSTTRITSTRTTDRKVPSRTTIRTRQARWSTSIRTPPTSTTITATAEAVYSRARRQRTHVSPQDPPWHSPGPVRRATDGGVRRRRPRGGGARLPHGVDRRSRGLRRDHAHGDDRRPYRTDARRFRGGAGPDAHAGRPRAERGDAQPPVPRPGRARHRALEPGYRRRLAWPRLRAIDPADPGGRADHPLGRRRRARELRGQVLPHQELPPRRSAAREAGPRRPGRAGARD